MQEDTRTVAGCAAADQISWPVRALCARRQVALTMVSPAMVTTLSSWVGISTQNLSHCQLFSLQGREEKINIRRTNPRREFIINGPV